MAPLAVGVTNFDATTTIFLGFQRETAAYACLLWGIGSLNDTDVTGSHSQSCSIVLVLAPLVHYM